MMRTRPESTHGPTIPTALLKTTTGYVEVFPAAEDWHEQKESLTLASQRGSLFCPECRERLKYIAKARTPHFRHLKDVQGCTNEDKYPDRANIRREKWFRNTLVASFRQALPVGTRIHADDYLGQRRPDMVVELSAGGSFILHVVTDNPNLEVWQQRSKEFEATGLPVVHVFGRSQVPEAIESAAVGQTEVEIADGLLAFQQNVARPLLVDIAHVANRDLYGLPLLVRDPATLYFFQPSKTPDAPGTLTILRGLMPDAADTVYRGVALKVEATGHGRGRLRFSLRHGFYTTDDLEVLTQRRAAFREQRRSGKSPKVAKPSEARKHPLRLRWERSQLKLIAQRERERVEAEERAERERAERAERERLRAEAAAREAERLREERARQAAERQKAKECYETLMRLLPEEGTRVLAGRIIQVPHPEVYTAPPAQWQGAVVGFAFRARTRFTLEQAASWLLWRGFSIDKRRAPAMANMRAFWLALEEAGLVSRRSDRDGVYFMLRPAPQAYQWPISATAQPPRTAALCVVCAAGNESVQLALTASRRYHDPDNGLCLCDLHRIDPQ